MGDVGLMHCVCYQVDGNRGKRVGRRGQGGSTVSMRLDGSSDKKQKGLGKGKVTSLCYHVIKSVL